ncbi:major facilitator superfamily MFS_1 [Scytonema sp. HK-05]|nr:major facilitator superfamily MFS_1 [Scytonema sp. HK-05]
MLNKQLESYPVRIVNNNASTKRVNQDPLGRKLVWIMAITSGAAAANLYYNQPLLAVIAQSLQAPSHATGWIPIVTQIGYALGIFLLVPLGDLMEKRRLILTMLVLTSVALVAAAVSLNLAWLLVASLAIGITTITPQLIVPFAAQLAKPQQRGRVVGTVMSGLLIGILLARTVSGFVGASFGWREMYWLASGLMIVLAVVLSRMLPKSQPSLRVSYPQLIGSLFKLIRQQPILREASLAGAMSFGAFSAFWSTLVFFLAQPPYHYGSEVTGLFGLVGVVGAAAAPIVGKIADKRNPKLTVGLGLVITSLSFLIFWVFGYHVLGLIAGVILLDLGVQTTMVSNQARIYSLPSDFHSRLNALYITFYFIGGALGSFLGAYGWSRWQWHGVCAMALIMLGVAFTTFIKRRQR